MFQGEEEVSLTLTFGEQQLCRASTDIDFL